MLVLCMLDLHVPSTAIRTLVVNEYVMNKWIPETKCFEIESIRSARGNMIGVVRRSAWWPADRAIRQTSTAANALPRHI